MVEEAKKYAAYVAVDDYITQPKMVVGIGSGSTIVYALERIRYKVEKEGLELVCIPSSFQSKELIVKEGLRAGDLMCYPEIDITIDGADEVNEHLDLIKGGGGCHLQEKIVAYNAKKFIVIADYRKRSTILGEKWKRGIPLEVIPLAFSPIIKLLEREFHAKATLRMDTNKAGPVITDNGNVILDAEFGLIPEPRILNSRLLEIPGLLETGLFIGMADCAFFGQEDGSVIVLDKVPTKTSLRRPQNFK